MTTLPTDIQRCIDQHLDAIDAALASTGMPRSERAAITGDVQGQIEEMLASRTQESPTVADVEAILAELDPPEAYAGKSIDRDVNKRYETPPGTEKPLSRFCPVAIIACVSAALAAGVGGWAWAIEVASWHQPRPEVNALMVEWILVGVAIGLAIFTTGLAILSISRIRHSQGRLHGLPLAVAMAVLYPLCGVNLLLAIIWMLMDRAMGGGLDSIASLIPVVALATMAVISFAVIRYAWRCALRPVM